MSLTLAGCATKGCPVPERCRIAWSDHGARDELLGAGLTPKSAPRVHALIWEYRRICHANEIDRE